MCKYQSYIKESKSGTIFFSQFLENGLSPKSQEQAVASLKFDRDLLEKLEKSRKFKVKYNKTLNRDKKEAFIEKHYNMEKNAIRELKHKTGLLLTKLQLYCFIRIRLTNRKQKEEVKYLQRLTLRFMRLEREFLYSSKKATKLQKAYAVFYQRYQKELLFIDHIIERCPNLSEISDEELALFCYSLKNETLKPI